MLDRALWALQIILAIKFLATGYGHALGVTGPKWQRPLELTGPRAGLVLRVSAVFCLLGALGLILPGVTGILPWLTPLAAAGLVLLMVRGILFHLRCRPGASVLPSVVLLSLAGFVALGRGWLAPL